jgi:hypothetical protein
VARWAWWRRVAFVAACTGASSFGLTGCGGDTGNQRSDQTSVLLVQTARSGSLIGAGSRGDFVLTLDGVSPSVVFFSDRPQRIRGQIPLTELLRQWRKAFANDPPNAAVQLLSAASSADTVAVEINEKPVYDPSRDGLVYDVQVLRSAEAGRRRT